MEKYKSRITGRIEEWWKKVCIKHNCKYYIHEDYPKCSYCTCPNNCILVDKPRTKVEHWIIIDDCEQFIAKCSECGEIVDSRMISKYSYCHCGAKMVDEQESEINNG